MELPASNDLQQEQAKILQITIYIYSCDTWAETD